MHVRLTVLALALSWGPAMHAQEGSTAPPKDPHQADRDVRQDLKTKCESHDGQACGRLGDRYEAGDAHACQPQAIHYHLLACKYGAKDHCAKPLHQRYRREIKDLQRPPARDDSAEQTIADPSYDPNDDAGAVVREHREARMRREIATANGQLVEKLRVLDEELTRPGTYDEAACQVLIEPPPGLTNTQTALKRIFEHPQH